MFKSLKSLFTPDPPKPVVPELLSLTIGRGVEIDPLMLRLRDSASLFSLPTPTLVFTAQGMCQLEDGQWIHRMYTDDNVMLQFVCARWDGDESIRDVTLFVPFRSDYPGNATALRLWHDRLRQSTLTLPPDLTFQRLWFDGSDSPQDPVTLTEEVYDDRVQTTPPRRINQTCMLYHRQLEGGDRDLLLAILETHNSDTSVELMVGIPLEPNHLKV